MKAQKPTINHLVNDYVEGLYPTNQNESKTAKCSSMCQNKNAHEKLKNLKRKTVKIRLVSQK